MFAHIRGLTACICSACEKGKFVKEIIIKIRKKWVAPLMLTSPHSSDKHPISKLLIISYNKLNCWPFKTVFEIIGKSIYQSHNRAQCLCYNILSQIITCYMQFVLLSCFVYVISIKCHFRNYSYLPD